MKQAPILTALDLWSLGHSARQIAEMLGFPNGAHVTRIVAHAREIGDKRATLHVAGTGRLIGRPGRMAVPPVAIPVPAIGKLRCVRGHARTPDNVYASNGMCKACQRDKDRGRKR
jgi:hypothetical protein